MSKRTRSRFIGALPLSCSIFSMRMVVGLLVFGLILVSSCVSNKQIAYLQFEDEVSSPKEIVTDSVIRKYETGELRYTLQPNDILNIKIASLTPEEYNPFAIADRYIAAGGLGGGNIGSQNASSNIGYKIDPFGYLNLPIIGQLKAAGMTIDQLENMIDSLAIEELEEPVTKISLMNFRYSMMGEVNSEGTVVSGDNSLTMMQAIANAGGPSEFGDISKVKVVRKIGGETFVFYVNLLDESFLNSDFYYVYPNDMIIVPPLRSRIYFKYITSNIAIFSSVMSFAASIIALIAIFGGTGTGG